MLKNENTLGPDVVFAHLLDAEVESLEREVARAVSIEFDHTQAKDR